jgi:hypothetical protein
VVSSSSNTSTRVGFTCELPAPWKRGERANSPMTATEPSAASGNTLPSFLSSTIEAAAARRESA